MSVETEPREEIKIEPLELPAIRVAVTEMCNLSCQYCPTDGDSVEMQAGRLEDPEFEEVLDSALSQGFSSFSFTGGEPLLSPKTAMRTTRLARYVNARKAELGLDGYTKLNTNGARLLDFEDEVRSAGFSELKISLDTLNPRTFKEVTKQDETVFKDTIDGILKFSGDIPIRMQMVVAQFNVEEVDAMVDFCRSNGLGLKLFDITSYDNALSGSADYALAGYIPLVDLREKFETQFGTPEIKYSTGGYGHPKRVFTTPEGAKLEIRDNAQGTHFSEGLCGSCPNYPCSEGISNIVIASDGHLRFCREGGVDQTIQSQDGSGELLPKEIINRNISDAAGYFAMSTFETTVSPRVPTPVPVAIGSRKS